MNHLCQSRMKSTERKKSPFLDHCLRHIQNKSLSFSSALNSNVMSENQKNDFLRYSVGETLANTHQGTTTGRSDIDFLEDDYFEVVFNCLPIMIL